MIEINKILNDYVNNVIDEDLAKIKLCDLSIVSNSFLRDMEKIYWKIDNQFCTDCDCGYVTDLTNHQLKMDIIEDVTGVIH